MNPASKYQIVNTKITTKENIKTEKGICKTINK